MYVQPFPEDPAVMRMGLTVLAGFAVGGLYLAYDAVAKQRRRIQARWDASGEFGIRPGLRPADYEQRCADALSRHGWKAARTGHAGDQGVDVIAEKGGVRVVLQTKLYSRAVGNKAVQEAAAGRGFSGAHEAAVVTNQGFTKSAVELANRLRVHLLHHSDLARADALFGLAEGAQPAATVPPRRVRWRDVWRETPTAGVLLWEAMVLFWFLFVMPIGTLIVTFLLTK